MATRVLFLSVIIAGMTSVPFATQADDQVETLEHALKTNETKNFYRHEIENMGWQITSVNYDKPDYVEYEIVKGDDSYEVQIDFDTNKQQSNESRCDRHAHSLLTSMVFFLS